MVPKWLWVVLVLSVIVLEAGLSNGCLKQEKLALLQLKPFFSSLMDEESSDCCQWEWVECNITTRQVTKLSLNYTSSEKWYLNASLFLPFEELRSLYLRDNLIAGCVENEGFEKLSKLKHLEILDLSYNHFNDSILSSLSKISSLKYLSLSADDLFTGSNHTNDLKWFSELTDLETLDLSSNNLRNPFLLNLDGLSSLRTLILSGNKLEGTIQTQGNGRQLKLINLEVLDLSYNFLNKSILADLSGLSNLKSLNLGGNQLNGLIGTKGSGRQLRLINLEVLDLSHNFFNNSILADLSGLSNLKSLNLGYNQLNGSIGIKEICAWNNLDTLDLSYNNLEQFVTSKGNGKHLMLSSLEVLNLSNNLFNGSILADLSVFSNLKSLSASYNRLEGSIDINEFCALGNLESLDMSENGINQFVTSKETRCLRKLKVLYLDSVSSTSLVSLIQPFSSVKTLFLRENVFSNKTVITQDEMHVLGNVEDLILDKTPLDISFLQSIGSLTSLKTLSLYYCHLTGTLPAQGWCYLKSLEELDLGRNVLSGNVASCLGNLTSLHFLDISDNLFVGNLASNPVTNLTMLSFLSLSNNSFQVPMSFISFANHSNLKVLLSDENMLVEQPVAIQTWSPKFQLKVFSLSYCTIEEQRKLQLPSFLYYQYDLRYIDFSHTKFGGIRFPHWLIENNTRLEELYMIDSSIMGPLLLPSHPNYNLMIFDISKNKVQHQIPPNFCSLFPNLDRLVMSQNAFKSNIPLCLGGMRFLSHLDISHNQLFGGIPENLAMSRSLIELRLSNNSLSGKMFPAIYRSNLLLGLYLDGNNFDGELPHISPVSSASLNSLDLSDNHLSEKLPIWLWNYTNLQILALSNNQLEGPIPMQLCNLDQLHFLDLSQNNLSGIIPPCFNPQYLSYLHLRKNKLSGPLPRSFSGSSYLVSLDLSENNFTENISDWIDALPDLSVLLLKANQFHGEFPMYLCKLESLSILDLSGNKLYGPIPSCLSNLTLKWSQKSIPRGIVLDSTSFSIILASTRVKIYDLKRSVDLIAEIRYRTSSYNADKYAEEEIVFSTKKSSYNYTGNILDSFAGIDLSCNKLTGIIPSELGNMGEIHALNLSHNSLTGSIPSTFSKLKQIESLDISYNSLNGTIPPQLTELNNLGVFTVAHNNLSGPLPDMKAQFGTFDQSSYEGNPLLCGPPLKNSCSEGDSPAKPPRASFGEDEEHGFIDMGDFYISFVVCYVIILLATAIVLYINPYWRQAWFYFIEECSTSCYYFIVDNFLRFPCFRKKNM